MPRIVESEMTRSMARHVNHVEPVITRQADALSALEQEIDWLRRTHPGTERGEDVVVVAVPVIGEKGVVPLDSENRRIGTPLLIANVTGEERMWEYLADGVVAANVIGIGVGDDGERHLVWTPPDRLDGRQVNLGRCLQQSSIDQRQPVTGQQIRSHRFASDGPADPVHAWGNFVHGHRLPSVPRFRLNRSAPTPSARTPASLA